MTAIKDRWWCTWREIERVSILHVDLTPDAQREAHAFTLLNAQEVQRARRFVVEPPRRRFVLCRAALRVNLCQRLDCRNDQLTFDYLQNGKPVADVGGRRVCIGFNLSHSGGHGLIAIADQGRIGVDVEERKPGRKFEDIGDRVYGPAERRLLSQAKGRHKAALFYRLWTLKEALIKGEGSGFRLNPSTFEVPEPMLQGERSGVFHFPNRPKEPWRLLDLGDARFAAALAMRLPDR